METQHVSSSEFHRKVPGSKFVRDTIFNENLMVLPSHSRQIKDSTT